MFKKALRDLLPQLHQEFVLVVFLMIPYAVQQLPWSNQQKFLMDNLFLVMLILWLIKVFIIEEATRTYKGFIVLVTGLSLFLAGLYAAITYYLDISIILLHSFYPFIYLFFPTWVMLEGALMLFLLGFDTFSKDLGLEKKIVIGKANVGDFIMVTIATILLVLIGEWVLKLPWFLNICVVFTINLIIINQFAHKPE